MKIGIIGRGFIGEAFYHTMSNFYEIDVWDIDKSKCTVPDLETLVTRCGVIFISVPTPMNKDGSCNTSIVENLVNEINKHAITQKIVVIRSTVPPGTTDRLNKEPWGISVIFNPEFLTEANYLDDFKFQDRIILGGSPEPIQTVISIYRKAFDKGTIFVSTTARIAEMVKYTTNTFLSTKVIFANEIKQLCDADGIDYNSMIDIVMLDDRVGTSHWKVPGPDGHYGFGGTCFPKDVNALLAHAKSLKVKMPFLTAMWKRNVELRPERDWEQLKGRAVM